MNKVNRVVIESPWLRAVFDLATLPVSSDKNNVRSYTLQLQIGWDPRGLDWRYVGPDYLAVRVLICKVAEIISECHVET